MLTRLKVSGFKNLMNVDVRFGPFTCIAGANGVGKSNLFDAIRFLSALADHPLIEAAQIVRDEEGRGGDIRNLFHRVGDKYGTKMSFMAEMIIPPEGLDDFGQPAKAKGTFLRYSLTIGLRDDATSLELLEERLQYVTLIKSDIDKHLLFYNRPEWFTSVITQEKRGRNAPFISTENKIIYQHYDGKSGKPYPRDASKLPRTVLSAVNAAESPTVVLAKREMQSWRLLQLEPSSLRKPDEFGAQERIGVDGSHLAATLARLARFDDRAVYQQVSNSLAELLDDVDAVKIDRDEKREILTLMVKGKDGTWHPAKSLSDGTLRFLALAVLSLDPESSGVICLEEPENGIHPQRIEAMLDLLDNIATDPTVKTGADNPLRQVIINTHSPAVVQQVSDDSLLFADLVEKGSEDEGIYKGVRFSCLPNTWRTLAQEPISIVPRGEILVYLNPVPSTSNGIENLKRHRVIDHPYIQPLLPFPDGVQ